MSGVHFKRIVVYDFKEYVENRINLSIYLTVIHRSHVSIERILKCCVD